MNLRQIARSGVVAVALALMAPVMAWAQASIGGVIRDGTGAVLPGVTVEAASPALIEKVRTAVTDGSGQYRIIDLRPGTYSVTFTLTGFNTARRDNIELTGSFSANINVELRVGTLEETLTVVAATPVVDTQNVVHQRVVTADLISSAPTARTFQNFAQLMPGVTIANVNRPAAQDVGGLSGNRQRILVHGSRFNDFSQALEGLSINILNSAGSSSSITPNPSEVQEFSFDLGAISSEIEKGGARVNIIPKEGGNRLSGTLFGTAVNSAFQSNNVTDELRARGAGVGNPLDKTWDFSGAFGGPISRDKLWFFAAGRSSGTTNVVTGVFYNANPDAFLYTPDLNRPALDDVHSTSAGLRLTWQATARNKFSLYALHQYECQCHVQPAAGTPRSPEAAAAQIFPVNQLMQASWTAPLTSRLLFQAGMLVYRQHLDNIPYEPVPPTRLSVTELSTGLIYRAPTSFGFTTHAQETYRASINYVTGSHALKFGMTLQHGQRWFRNFVNGDLNLQFLNEVPRSVTMNATPFTAIENLDANLGIYAQEQWRINRLTVNAGLRFDQIKASIPEQNLDATRFVPARQFAAVPNVPNWKDISPRLGASYDLFGDGKTALKVTVSRYVLGELVDFARANNPVFTSVNSASRTWTDRNGNFHPDCDFLNFAENGECARISNLNFGRPNVTTQYDDALKTGWGKRGYNWEMTFGGQRELRAGLSVDATFYRRSYGNFTATDNLRVTPADFDPYCVTAPVDSRLPGGGGYDVCGLHDINTARFGQSQNFVTFAEKFGKQSEIYTGYDVNVSGRLPRGITVQGGLNMGRTATNNCFVIDSPQELKFCDITPPFQAQIKGFAIVPLPWDLQASGSFQSIAGPMVTASYTATNAQVAPSLGRNLAAGANATVTVPLIEPGTLYGERMYQVDFRLAKTLRFGARKLQANLDLFNALNGNAVLTHNNTYGPAWLRPTYLLPGRLVKISGQFDF